MRPAKKKEEREGKGLVKGRGKRRNRKRSEEGLWDETIPK